ncbi:hypothetical protein DFQ27_007952 [Actinomortierella ambigua]|uniref:Uncharacterized protein n=1 Tax=Actinomortierella ambigua TaxID=1343610 RepID=A0A9P6TZ03_9FUNG|nr:hypothetical protein DFQ27_007952 [Actinomortierella ambigua]
MSGNITAGKYLGAPPRDPSADIRNLFAVRENQQDGLGTLLKFSQIESKFIVGSTDTSGFTRSLHNNFAGVVDRKDILTMSPARGPLRVVAPQIHAFLNRVPDKVQLEKFQNGLSGTFKRTFVHFCIQLDNQQLRFWISKLIVSGSVDSMFAMCFCEIWTVNRRVMASRADELVKKCKLKDAIDRWAKGISSDGY